MRYLLAVILLVLGVAQSARAQGTVLFANDSGSVVCCGDRPAPAGYWTAGLYAGPEGTGESQLTLVASVPIDAAPGRFDGGIVTLDGVAGGALATLQVRVWETEAGASYEEAVSGIGLFDGISLMWTQAIGDPASGEPAVPIVPGFTGVELRLFGGPLSVCPIPEPSVLLLACLGGGCLLFKLLNTDS